MKKSFNPGFIAISTISTIITIAIITIAAITMTLCLPASAGEWREDGEPLYMIAEGSINGSVIVQGGHGLTWEDIYVEYFDLPKSGNIKYARLYVPMWNYDEGDWVEISINNNIIERKEIPDYVSGWGVSSYIFTVADELSAGINEVSVTYHNTNGAPYAIVLVAVNEDPKLPQTRFWISEGNHALSAATNIDTGKIDFEGDIHEGIKNATLWTMIIAGTKNENDSLYFNSHLLGIDVGSARSGTYFDLDSWDVTKLLTTADSNTPGNTTTGSTTTSNTVTFERGDELYIHPMVSVLTVSYHNDNTEDFLKINTQVESTEAKVPTAVFVIIALSLIFFAYRIVDKK